MNKFFQRQCVSCDKPMSSFFAQIKILNGKPIKCEVCNNVYVAKEPWLSIFNFSIALIPIVYIVTIMFLGFLTGSILFILGLVLITGVIAYLIPIKKRNIRNIRRDNSG